MSGLSQKDTDNQIQLVGWFSKESLILQKNSILDCSWLSSFYSAASVSSAFAAHEPVLTSLDQPEQTSSFQCRTKLAPPAAAQEDVPFKFSLHYFVHRWHYRCSPAPQSKNKQSSWFGHHSFRRKSICCSVFICTSCETRVSNSVLSVAKHSVCYFNGSLHSSECRLTPCRQTCQSLTEQQQLI